MCNGIMNIGNKNIKCYIIILNILKTQYYIARLEVYISHIQYEKIKKLSHPNILKIYDCFEYQEKFYIVEEYYDRTFEDLINKEIYLEGVAPVEFYLHYFIQISSGLLYLHQNNYIHQKLKPYSIAVIDQLRESDLSNVKLICLNALDNSNSQNFTSLIQSSIPFDVYNPIELYTLPLNISENIDIWSFGILSYYYITHKLPFESQEELFKSIDRDSSNYFPKISSYRIDINELLQYCVSCNPNNRPKINIINSILSNIEIDPSINIIIISKKFINQQNNRR